MREKTRQRKRNSKKESAIRTAILQHIQNNAKEYLSVLILFAIGIVLGVIFINKMGETQRQEVSTYIQDFITNIKDNQAIDTGALLKQSIQKNLLLGIILWFVGSTMIGIPLVYLIMILRGFCLGYTISAMMAVLETGKGLLFCFTSTFFQNLIFIPCLLAMAVSGIKLYKYVVKDKNKENIKQEILRHTIFSGLCIGLLVLSSFIETYVSTNLLLMTTNYL